MPVNTTGHKYNIVRFCVEEDVAEAVKIVIVIISLRAHCTEAYQNLIADCYCIFS
jgi:hypothetical protein